MKRWAAQKQNGFTIVELLIVIVVIAILAAITIVAFLGVQERARQSKIKSDLTTLEKAVLSARTATGKTLWGITGGSVTADACGGKASGTDIAALPKADACWTKYNDTLAKISTASGMDVKGMLDPWGRPYWIYENEGRATATDCTKDTLSVLNIPHVQWSADYALMRYVPNSLPNC